MPLSSACFVFAQHVLSRAIIICNILIRRRTTQSAYTKNYAIALVFPRFVCLIVVDRYVKANMPVQPWFVRFATNDVALLLWWSEMVLFLNNSCPANEMGAATRLLFTCATFSMVVNSRLFSQKIMAFNDFRAF